MDTPHSPLIKLLNHVETIGNRLPHPSLIFIYLCMGMLLVSWLSALLGVTIHNPINQQELAARSLLSTDGLHWMLTNTVSNFTHFAPVGTVLVAMLGLGIAEHSGLIGALLKKLVKAAPERLLGLIIIYAGVLSSLASDAGYVVLIPLAAIIFKSAGRSPLAGIAAAFAGVSGGFSANLMIGPVDALLAGITTEAVQLVASDYEVNATGNFYFIAISSIYIAIIINWVLNRWIEPRFDKPKADTATIEIDPAAQSRALKLVGYWTIAFVIVLLWGLLPEDGILRDPATQSITRSPFITGIVSIIAVYFAICGIIFGKASGSFANNKQIIDAMEKAMEGMAAYLVLMFFAAQFVNYFAWSQLGTIFAIQGADWLKMINLPAPILLTLFIILSATLNLFIGSASAKWALIGPIFVPMLYLSGISPEATQMAYRIGDSSTNIITPLMPYFALVVAFAQKHDKQAGIGTITAMMLPFSLALIIAWTGLLLTWMLLDLPLGPGAYFLTP